MRTIEDYKKEQKSFLRKANNQVILYFNNPRGNSLYNAQDIVYDFLRSREAQLRVNYLEAENALKDLKKHEILKKPKIEKRKKEYNTRIGDLTNVLSTSLMHNPYVSGSLKHNACESFELEDYETYTLFNEVEKYLEQFKKDENDLDRRNLYERIAKFDSLVRKERNRIVDKEKDFVYNCLEVIEREMKSGNFLLSPDTSTVYSDFVRRIKEFKTNLDYLIKLKNSHVPKYEDKDPKKLDGFGIDSKNNSSGILEYMLKSVGKDREVRLVSSSKYDLKTIFDLLERKEEVSRIISLIERANVALKERNNAVIGDSKTVINYNDAISYSEDLLKYCRKLLSKYEKELKELNYNELKEKAEKAVEIKAASDVITANTEMREKGKFSPKQVNEIIASMKDEIIEKGGDTTDINDAISLGERKAEYDKIKPMPYSPNTESLRERNKRTIELQEIPDGLLDVAADDLCLFGFLNENDYSKLSESDKTKVIDHCEKLRSLANLSIEEMAQERATWPRIENGKLVQNSNPKPSDVLVQKALDERRAIYARIITYGRRENGPKL